VFAKPHAITRLAASGATPLTGRGRPDPVAEVRDAGRFVDMVEAACAEKAPPVEDAELEARTVFPAAQRRADPLLGIGQRIRRPAPVHPAADLDARFVDGAEHRRRVAHLERPDVDPGSPLREPAEDQAEASPFGCRRRFEHTKAAAQDRLLRPAAQLDAVLRRLAVRPALADNRGRKTHGLLLSCSA